MFGWIRGNLGGLGGITSGHLGGRSGNAEANFGGLQSAKIAGPYLRGGTLLHEVLHLVEDDAAPQALRPPLHAARAVRQLRAQLQGLTLVPISAQLGLFCPPYNPA